MPAGPIVAGAVLRRWRHEAETGRLEMVGARTKIEMVLVVGRQNVRRGGIHGNDFTDGFSEYYLADEIAGNCCAVGVLLGSADWDCLTARSTSSFWPWWGCRA